MSWSPFFLMLPGHLEVPGYAARRRQLPAAITLPPGDPAGEEVWSSYRQTWPSPQWAGITCPGLGQHGPPWMPVSTDEAWEEALLRAPGRDSGAPAATVAQAMGAHPASQPDTQTHRAHCRVYWWAEQAQAGGAWP